MSRSNTAKKKQKHAIVILSSCICETKQHFSIKQDVNQNCSKVSKLNINPGSGQGLCKLDGSDRLWSCFDYNSKSDPGDIFDKNVIFSAFCSKCRFFFP